MRIGFRVQGFRALGRFKFWEHAHAQGHGGNAHNAPRSYVRHLGRWAGDEMRGEET